MRSACIITCIFFPAVLLACGSSDAVKNGEKQGHHADSGYVTGTVYIDQVTITEEEGKNILKITGHLPDGCSELYKMDYAIEGTDLLLSLKSRRPAGAMCTQALVDFTYHLNEIDEQGAAALTHYVVDGKKFELK